MAVLQMQKISICALKKDQKKLLKMMQAMGVMEVSQVLEDESFQKKETLSEKQGFEKKSQIAEQALGVLESYAPEKKSMFATFEGKRMVKSEEFQQTVAAEAEVMEKAGDIIEKNKIIAELKAEIIKLDNQVKSLEPWMTLDIPMEFQGTEKTAAFIGTVSWDTTAEHMCEKIARCDPQLETYDITTVSSDADGHYVVVLCLRNEVARMEEALRSCGFARQSNLPKGKPSEAAKIMQDRIQILEKKILENTEAIEKLAADRDKLKNISDYYRIEAEKCAVEGELPQSNSTFVMGGYIPQKSFDAVKKTLEDTFDCVVDTEVIGEEEEPPVLLKNSGMPSSVEGVLEAYGLPRKGEVDPTTIMSFFYIFFFGMMLSDAAYGAIIAIACLVILKKYPRMDKGMKKSISMFMYCGISTIVWGVLFGGYFGDVVDVVSRTFFGKTVTIPALWFMPLNNPMKLLIYSMAFGTIHLFTGLGIKGYMLLREKKVLDFFCDIILWYAFLIGLILMLVPSDIFAAIAQTKIVFPPFLTMLAKGLAIGGAAGLLLMSGRSSKNPGLRLALGAYDIYNITGWLSDVLSYSRLLALGLATGVIASVINQMGSMFGGGVAGAVGFIIVFIVGHILNLAINLLGAYVHTNRLQFVEFFGKFYEGGGQPFQPFNLETKYIDVKEEKIL